MLSYPAAVRLRRKPRPGLARRNAFNNARAPRDPRSVADADVVVHPDLAAQHDAAPERRAASDSGRPRNDTVRPRHDVVPNLTQIVDFAPRPDAGFAESTAVDTGVCPDLDVVLELLTVLPPYDIQVSPVIDPS